MKTKACKQCGEVKPLHDFYKHTVMADGHTSKCKVCRNAHVKAWCKKNPEQRQRIKIESAKRNPTPQSRTPEARAESWARWYAEIKGTPTYIHMIEGKARRNRLIHENATPGWAVGFFMEEAYDLARRRTQVTGAKWHVDHIVPLQSKLVCGLHTHDNLQVILAHDNDAKHNRHWPGMPSGRSN